MIPPRTPPRLIPGATLGLLAPASPTEEPERVDEVISHLRSQGFTVKEGRHLRARAGYLAGSDEERVADLHALFGDPEVRGIFALRGGYGSCRLLPLLDYELIRANAKPFVGYSDITALHHALAGKAGLVTYHGPNANEAFRPENGAVLRRALMEPPGGDALFSAETVGGAIRTQIPGCVRGRLLGGNMTCLLRLLGTPYAPDFTGAILFLEDIGEKAYRVDGMFAHLRLAGVLDQIGGLVLGRFDHLDEAERGRIDRVLREEAGRLAKPCLSGAPIGHFPGQVVMPVGAMAELDSEAGWVKEVV